MKTLRLTREQATWLYELIDNTPYDEGLDGEHRSDVMYGLMELEEEWSA